MVLHIAIKPKITQKKLCFCSKKLSLIMYYVHGDNRSSCAAPDYVRL